MLPCPRTRCARHALALTPLECAAERRFRPVGGTVLRRPLSLARSFHALQQECFTTRYHSEGCSLFSTAARYKRSLPTLGFASRHLFPITTRSPRRRPFGRKLRICPLRAIYRSASTATVRLASSPRALRDCSKNFETIAPPQIPA